MNKIYSKTFIKNEDFYGSLYITNFRVICDENWRTEKKKQTFTAEKKIDNMSLQRIASRHTDGATAQLRWYEANAFIWVTMEDKKNFYL